MSNFDELNIEFTGELANLAEIVGKNKAYQLAQEFGDLRKIYFSKKKKGKFYQRLCNILGSEQTNALCDLYSGENLDISQQKRASMILRYHDAGVLARLGYSTAGIARELKITERYVKEMLKDQPIGQLSLLENKKVLPSGFACESVESRAVAMRGDFSGTSLRRGVGSGEKARNAKVLEV